jgi:diguanylate cyclase (GGDEF)-like protein
MNLTYAYFFYGLSFFSLGISIIFYPKKGSEFRIAKALVFISLFGILHGIHEWAEMFNIAQGPGESIVLGRLCLLLLPLSFSLLVTFGMKSLLKKDASIFAIYTVPTGLFILWIILTATSQQHFQMGDIWARYLLGAPGAIMTGCAFLKYLPEFTHTKTHIARNILIAAGMFFLYAICAGLVVPDAGFFPASAINYTFVVLKTGIPIQVFRSICAIFISYSVISILSQFTWEMQEQLRNLSLKDELTGLFNRRGFFALAEQQIKIEERQNRVLQLIVGDMDNLKQINDTLGHAEGDAAIKEIAGILRESFRQSDVIGRIGGDEFAILQIEVTPGNADDIISRLQNNIVLHNKNRKSGYNLSMSIGISVREPGSSSSINELLRHADHIMYQQKEKKSSAAAMPEGDSNEFLYDS